MLRLTVQRQIILEELQGMKTHPTAGELYENVRQRLPRISLGTVYRNLGILTREGVIRSIKSTGNQKRFDACLESHSHIRCVDCGRVDDVSSVSISDKNIHCEAQGYKVIGHQLEFLGICSGCRRGSDKEPQESTGISYRGKTEICT